MTTADRPADRVESDSLESLLLLRSDAPTGSDCKGSDGTLTPRRVSASKLARLQADMPARDLAILRSLANHRLLTSEQIKRLHFDQHATLASSARRCREVCARLSVDGLLYRLQRRVGGIRGGSGAQIYALSPLGWRALGSKKRKRMREPSASFVAHTLATAEIAVDLTASGRSQMFELLDLETEPRCWRGFTSAIKKEHLRPDLLVRLKLGDDELSWFIECDLGTESGPRIEHKCRTYQTYWQSGTEQAEQGVFPRVLWSAPDVERARHIARTIADAKNLEPRLFAVTTSDLTTAVLTEQFDSS